MSWRFSRRQGFHGFTMQAMRSPQKQSLSMSKRLAHLLTAIN
uniref:Uncharacterized protein n=1 Tax=Rhizophora mucronata TaxID=61149 RepID=A0A2P2PQ60_RHIMU